MTPGCSTFDLTSARINAGYSIRGFARHLKVTEQTIRRLEHGLDVRPENAKPIADFFDVKVTDLMKIGPGRAPERRNAA